MVTPAASRRKPARNAPEPETTKTWVSRARARTPYKLTDEVVERICARIAAGSFIKHACEAEFVTDEALRLLCERDDGARAAVSAAGVSGTEALLKRLEKTEPEYDDEGRRVGGDDWKKFAWLAERRDREVLGPPTSKVESKSELTGANGAPIRVEMTPADARAELDRRLSALSPESRNRMELIFNELEGTNGTESK